MFPVFIKIQPLIIPNKNAGIKLAGVSQRIKENNELETSRVTIILYFAMSLVIKNPLKNNSSSNVPELRLEWFYK